MRWGAGTLRWVRPLRGLTCCFGEMSLILKSMGFAPENSARASVYGTRNKRVRERGKLCETLMQAKVMVDASARAQAIESAPAGWPKKKDCMLVDDPALVTETAGLVEWPVPLLGRIDDAFMDVPEVLTSVMRTHQKYFALKIPKTKSSRLISNHCQYRDGRSGRSHHCRQCARVARAPV